MSGHNTRFPDRHARPFDYQRNVDIFFKPTFLSRVQAMLRDVVAIISGVDDICVVQNSVIRKTSYETFD
jgi:hypothetical protein